MMYSVICNITLHEMSDEVTKPRSKGHSTKCNCIVNCCNIVINYYMKNKEMVISTYVCTYMC